MGSGPVKRRRLIYRVISKASADRTGLDKPLRAPEPSCIKRQTAPIGRRENWTGYARQELRKSRPRRSHRGAAAAGQEHRLRARAHGADRGQGPDPVDDHSGRADRGCDLRDLPDQDRQLAEPVVPFRFQGLQAVRGRHQALPGDRIRRAGRGRGQDAAGAREPREDPRHGHRPATGRGCARSGFAVLGAAGAGTWQAAGGAVSAGTAGGCGLRQVRRNRQSQRDHSRQAAV